MGVHRAGPVDEPRPRGGAGGHQGVEQLDDRGVARRLPRAVHPDAAAVAPGPGARRRGGPPQRRAGFTSVSFLESPQRLELPPITNHEHWEPFFRACEETDTVISLHCGASGFTLQGSPGTGLNTQVTMFPGTAFCAAVDWVWAGIPVRTRPQDRPERGRHRLGADGDRPARLRDGALGGIRRRRGVGVRPQPQRAASPELLVLHARRPQHA